MRHKDVEERKRNEIIQHKTKRIQQISDKLKEIDEERQQRRNRRVQKSFPERGISSMSVMSDRTTESIRDSVLEKDPLIRKLRAKLQDKKEGTSHETRL